ncbi:MAG: 50S ribosomal protein L9 [Bdellovibrionaceae bacterium]|nr:50S ribosomal protein L9 [Pseudobdellovibrionaceae bacterium]
MKVILKKDVRDLGRSGDMVNVADGYARNFLFPRQLAAEATEGRVKEFEHWTRVATSKKKKAVADLTQIIEKLKAITVSFQMPAGENDKLFGSVTAKDISDALAKQGFSVEKKDITVDAIKVLGQYKAKINFGDGLKTEIAVSVERAEEKK